MTSKYETYWQDRLDAILALFDQARTTGASSQLPLTDLDALGERGSWYGKLEIVAGQSVYDSAAHLAALGALLTPHLQKWAEEDAWIVTVSKDQQLTVEKTDPQKTNWFENAYRVAKQDETIRRAAAYLGPLTRETEGSGMCRTAASKPVYVLFTTQEHRWLAPRRARLEAAATENGDVVISMTDETSGRFGLWIIPAAELVAAIQKAAFAPSLDRGNAYNFNLQTDEAADLIRQLGWDIRPYRRESGQTKLTRAGFRPVGSAQQPEKASRPSGTKGPVLAKPFSEMFADWEEAEWAFDLLREAAQCLGVAGPDDPLAAWTLRRMAGQSNLHFSYGQWLVLGLAGANGHLILKLALFRDRLDLPTTRVESFTQREGETPVSLHYLEAQAWRQLEDSEQAVFGETLDYIKQLFAGWQASPYHKYTDAPLALAVFDANARRRLLKDGPKTPAQRFWKIAPGDDAWQWSECRDSGFIAIGWDELGDLSNLDRAGFEARRAETQQEHPDWTNDALEQAWKFAQIQDGDRIVANRGTTEILALGTVTGPYYFVPGVRHGHRLPVQWDDTTVREVNEGGWRRTLVELTEAKFSALASKAARTSADDKSVGTLVGTEAPEPYDADRFLSTTSLRVDDMTELREMLEDRRQIILYGPPGTGKTFVARELGKLLTGLAKPLPERMEIVQFHPAYSYEDFIEGIRPESKAGADGRYMIDYPARPGVFQRFCQQAQSISGPCVFIIDEINRGNIPRIFGELMLLLEYRGLDVTLAYSGRRFCIPDNVYLIGTMNTADRSIALVDFALRRRFHFFRFSADPELLSRWLEANPVEVTYLLELYRRLSKDAIDDPDFAIGPSHFMRRGLTEAQLQRIWRRSIEPYLKEYYVDQRERSKADRWAWDSALVKAIRQGQGNG